MREYVLAREKASQFKFAALHKIYIDLACRFIRSSDSWDELRKFTFLAQAPYQDYALLRINGPKYFARSKAMRQAFAAGIKKNEPIPKYEYTGLSSLFQLFDMTLYKTIDKKNAETGIAYRAEVPKTTDEVIEELLD